MSLIITFSIFNLKFYVIFINMLSRYYFFLIVVFLSPIIDLISPWFKVTPIIFFFVVQILIIKFRLLRWLRDTFRALNLLNFCRREKQVLFLNILPYAQSICSFIRLANALFLLAFEDLGYIQLFRTRYLVTFLLCFIHQVGQLLVLQVFLLHLILIDKNYLLLKILKVLSWIVTFSCIFEKLVFLLIGGIKRTAWLKDRQPIFLMNSNVLPRFNTGLIIQTRTFITL